MTKKEWQVLWAVALNTITFKDGHYYLGDINVIGQSEDVTYVLISLYQQGLILWSGSLIPMKSPYKSPELTESGKEKL